MFLNLGLNKKGGFFRINADTEPVAEDTAGAVLDNYRILEFAGQRVPVGGKKEAFIIVLQFEASWSGRHDNDPGADHR